MPQTNERPTRKHVPKGTYAASADPAYVERRDQVRNYVPEVLNLLLKVKRIEHADLAAKMGLSVSALRDRLRGKTEISIGELVAIAELLDVPMSVFIDRTATISDILGVKTCSPKAGGINPTTKSAWPKSTLHLALPSPTDCNVTALNPVGTGSCRTVAL